MTFFPIPTGVVSSSNSTTSTLSGSATFTGVYENVSTYTSISIIITCDVAGTLYGDNSSDGTNVDNTVQLSDGTINISGVHTLGVTSEYFRIRLVNGSSSQTTLRLQTIYHTNSKTNGAIQQGQAITSYSNVLNTRSAITSNVGGTNNWVSVPCNNSGYLYTSVREPLSGFGEIMTITPNPVAQIDFVYGINIFTTFNTVVNTGSATSANSLLTISSGTTTGSSALVGSKRYINYRSGQGCMGRFTALFSSGTANTLQYAGMGTPTLNNGYFFGYSGITFGIFLIKGGTPTFTAKSSWNVDVCDGTSSSSNPSGFNLNPANGNVYQIKYQYLGFGNIFFFIENPNIGGFMLVHQIKYPNLYTGTNILQPHLNLIWYVSNGTTTTNISLSAGSGALFLEGPIKYLGPRFGITGSQTTGVNTQIPIVILQNCTTYNTINNRSQIKIRYISCGITNAGNAQGLFILSVILNPVSVTGASYVAINGTLSGGGSTITAGNSISSYDISASATSGGTLVFSSVGGNETSIDCTDFDIYLQPGDVLVFALTTTIASTGNIGITWNEDI